ncbi:MAG TPA: hypothetical protein VJU52_15405 [Flavobacterium sp.]|nr:hypothetical protein [Flavobacterium sp.]
MLKISLLTQIVLFLLSVIGYTAYLYYSKRKMLKKKRNENKVKTFRLSGDLSMILEKKSKEKLEHRSIQKMKIINHSNGEMLYSIPLASDLQILETDSCLLIKGTVESIASICDILAIMEQLPQGCCVKLGDWKLFVMEVISQSSREDKLIVMPRSNWLFMSNKLRGSIYGEDTHPYIYDNEPFTFKKVLDYGIGVEATDWLEYNTSTL